MKEKIALIGAGAMGGAIGTRLLQMGHELQVFDLDKERVAALVVKGGIAAQSAAEAAANSDFIIVSLNSAHIVEIAVFGKGGVSENARPGTMIIDMSSIDPVSTAEFAARAKKDNLHWVDCPLSGGAPKALVGELTVFVGGEVEDFERSKSVMLDLCANFSHMGPSGAGQTTKLINQVLCGLNFSAVAEATKLALDAGIAAEKIPAALAGGRADSAILQEYMPRMATVDFAVSGRIANMVKDLNATQDLARQTGTSMPMTAICAEQHRLMTAAGYGGADQAALIKYFGGPSTGDMKPEDL